MPSITFGSLEYSDFPFLNEYEPPNWGDLVPRFKYFVDSTFCKPVKLLVNGKMVAIGTTIFHKDSAWLASIIVHPDQRNQGFGKMITQKLIDSIDTLQFTTIYLDATDLGFPVYTKLGFEMETTYAHLKSEEKISGLKISESVIQYKEEYKEELLQLDRTISCEDRMETLIENFSSAKVYVNNNRVEGFFLPSIGNGPIIASNDIAGFELIKFRLQNNYNAILPSENISAIKFIQENNLVQFRKSRRMYIGKKRAWQANRIYNRISGQLG
jgi:N-acetylglutamate synthase-like GNAT family acetyltransferase